MKRLIFFPFIGFLVILDCLLLSRPNFLGKVGLAIYHYNYLRTFPRALLTGSIGMSIAISVCEAIVYLANRGLLGRRISNAIFLVLSVICSGLLIKTIVDFSSGSYSHTGLQ